VPGEWVTGSDAGSDGVLLYLHGGAYMLGSPISHRPLTAALVLASGMRVLALDYRLAPEHPFPAAVEDALAAYRWLLESGTPRERIVVGGDSAGGGLALALLVVARYFGMPLPAAALCLSPWVDLEMAGLSWFVNIGADPILPRRDTSAAQTYLNGAPPTTPLASPLYADLAGLPPLLVQVGSVEPLYSEILAFVQKARMAGVDVTLEIWPEMFHVWQIFAAMLPEAREAVEHLATFARARTGSAQRARAAVSA